MFAFRPRNLIYKFLSQPYSFCLGLREKISRFYFFPFFLHTLLACLLGTKAQLVHEVEKKKSFFATLKCGFLITQCWKFNVSSIYSPDDREFKQFTAPFAYVTDKMSFHLSQQRKGKIWTLICIFWKWKIFCGAPINTQKMKNWSFPAFYSSFCFFFFFKSKNIVKIKWEHQRLISRYLKLLLSLIHLVRGSKK